MTNEYIERCSTSLVTREMPITITMRHHFTIARMAINGKKRNRIVGKDMKKSEPLYILVVL